MFQIEKIITWFKRKFNRYDLIFLLGILLLFFLSRLLNLEQLPIFCDEGIYIRWAKTAWHDASWRFISLTDGKQPLHTWGMIPFLKLFPNNALVGGRMFSVATGLFALTGMFVLLFYFFNKKTAYFGSLLYIFVSPYFLFYDRMALIDSGVNAFFIWILFFSVLLAKTLRLDIALIFGFTAGMGLLSKSSVQVFFGLSSLAAIFVFSKSLKKSLPRIVNFIFLFAIAGIIAFAIYNIQRLSPFLHFVVEKNKTFIMTFDEWIKQPFAVFFNNIRAIPEFVFSEMGFITVIFGIFGYILLYKNNRQLFYYLVLWIIIPFLGIAFMTRVLYPRYIIFFGTMFTIGAAYFFANYQNKKITSLFFGIIVLSTFIFNYYIWFNYQGLLFTQTDRGQYIEAPTVGLGIKEMVQFAREKSKEKPVIIIAEGDFGVTGDQIETYIRQNDRIHVKGYWPLDLKNLVDNQKELEKNYVYVITAHNFSYPSDWPLKLIKAYYKYNKISVNQLFELTK